MFCREQVARFIDARPAIQAEGFRLAFIGNGTSDHLAAFLEQFPEAGEAFTDPSRSTYRALELRHGVGSLLSLGMVANGLRAVRSGHKQGLTAGDPMQQGGLAVFSMAGSPLFIHRDATAGDSMSARLLLEILQELNENARQRGRRATS